MALEFAMSQHRPSQFLDYRVYLEALFQAEKSVRERYSYKEFSEEIGLGASNVAWLIIHGQRKLTRNTFQKLTETLGVKGAERRYLEVLMKYTHASEPKNLDFFLKKLVEIRSSCLGNADDERTLKFYSEWQHAIIFEMIGLQDFQSNPRWIREHLNFELTDRQILDSLSVLEGLRLIRYDSTLGRHIKLVQDFSTDSEVLGLGVVQFHKQMIDLGKSSMEKLSPDLRDIGAVTVAVSDEGFQRIKREVEDFRSYLMFLASQYGTGANELVQVNLQAFLLTHPHSKRGGR